MQRKKFLASVCGLALLLGLTTSLVGCETPEPEEGGETAPTEEPVAPEGETE